MKRFLGARLSLMMFLQFFVWGAWYTSVAVYMTAEGMGNLTHWPYTVNPVAAIAAPFFLGLIADRYFSTEKVLGVLHLLGGLVLLFVPQMSGAPVAFILLLLLYNLCYMPTLGLANSLAFHNIQSQEKQFPLIRVFGTIGWIVAGLFVSFALKGFVSAGRLPEQTPLPIFTTAVASILLGLYSFSLPHTPPRAAGQRVSIRSIVGLDALQQLGSKPFYVFIISSLLICIPLAAYYNFTQLFLEGTGFQNIAGTQTLGQMSEVVFMLLMPAFFARFGVKWMLLVGMGSWALRYVLFALGAPDTIVWMIVLGILLHGVCYDFFFVTGQIYVDKKSTPQIRGQAQGMLVLVTYGIGMLIGAQVAGNLFNRFLGEAPALTLTQWRQFWLVPAACAAVVMVGCAMLCYDRLERAPVAAAEKQPVPGAT
ncbi:MAG: MFS transporter [Gemmatimonadetes bacterium]|nr:MFS transporter [Gemmatimonadota bacterium]